MEVLDFVEKYIVDLKGYYKGFYLVGSFGIGKIYLLGVIVRELVIVGFIMILVYFLMFVVEMK